MSQQVLPQTRHYSADDVKIIDKSAGYNGFFKVNVYRLQHRLFAGAGTSPSSASCSSAAMPPPCCPMTRCATRSCWWSSFASAPSRPAPPLAAGLVAGIIDPGEVAEEVVRREAVEEAGIEVGREHAISYLVSPGGSTERIEVYVGEVDASKAEGSTVWRKRVKTSGSTW